MNQEYYGAGATAYRIVMGRDIDNPAALELRQQLAAL